MQKTLIMSMIKHDKKIMKQFNNLLFDDRPFDDNLFDFKWPLK